MISPGLTVMMRSCLLRAARARLAQLNEDFETMRDHNGGGNGKAALTAEIACISNAIAWLWTQPAGDEGSR